MSDETDRRQGDDRSATLGRPTVDEMSEWSFPASDPPATWNWEPRPADPPSAGGHDEHGAS
jgi:hypothetical protein